MANVEMLKSTPFALKNGFTVELLREGEVYPVTEQQGKVLVEALKVAKYVDEVEVPKGGGGGSGEEFDAPPPGEGEEDKDVEQKGLKGAPENKGDDSKKGEEKGRVAKTIDNILGKGDKGKKKKGDK